MAVFLFSSFNSGYDTPVLLPSGTIAAFGPFLFFYYLAYYYLLENISTQELWAHGYCIGWFRFAQG